MMARLAILLMLLAPASASFTLEAKSSLTFDMEAAKNRPVSKVITLLKDMKKQLEAEGEEDEKVYEEMTCWCETNDKEKTKAIADAEAKINDLTIAIEELGAASVRLQKEIKSLEEENAKNQAALDKATAIRFKELGEFNGEEKDVLQSISALKAAIVVLSKHHPGSAALLQSDQQLQMKLFQIATVMQHEMQKHADMLRGVLTRSQRKAVAAFIQSPEDYFDASPTFKQSYAPQSGQILGILKQMKETFESNLSQSQKDELAASEGYESTKAAKEDEIAAGQAQVETKVQELATTDEKLAQAKQDLEDTQEQLSADEKFLRNLKEQCAAMDAEWEVRTKTRQEEIEAVGKALEILSSDDAHDLFTKTFNFVQEKESSMNSKRRDVASKLLAAVGRKTHNPKLVTLALNIRLDAFTKVKKAIDDMIAELLTQQKDEVKHKDFCRDSLNENQRNTEKKEREKKGLEETIDDLTMTIDELTKDLETLKAEIEEMSFQLKRAGEDREKENKDFQMVAADNKATQTLLKQALQVLKNFYDKKAAMLQKGGKKGAKQTPPVAFKAYKKNASAGGVMGMIQQIINDAKAAEAEAIKAEEDAQKAYEAFVKDTNTGINERTKSIVEKTEAKAKAEGEKTKAEQALEEVVLELDGLSTEASDLHNSCDFVLKNFEIRQTARAQEIEALRMVKQILSGAKFSDFLQSDVFADADSSSWADSTAAAGVADDGGDPLEEFLDEPEQ